MYVYSLFKNQQQLMLFSTLDRLIIYTTTTQLTGVVMADTNQPIVDDAVSRNRTRKRTRNQPPKKTDGAQISQDPQDPQPNPKRQQMDPNVDEKVGFFEEIIRKSNNPASHKNTSVFQQKSQKLSKTHGAAAGDKVRGTPFINEQVVAQLHKLQTLFNQRIVEDDGGDGGDPQVRKHYEHTEDLFKQFEQIVTTRFEELKGLSPASHDLFAGYEEKLNKKLDEYFSQYHKEFIALIEKHTKEVQELEATIEEKEKQIQELNQSEAKKDIEITQLNTRDKEKSSLIEESVLKVFNLQSKLRAEENELQYLRGQISNNREAEDDNDTIPPHETDLIDVNLDNLHYPTQVPALSIHTTATPTTNTPQHWIDSQAALHSDALVVNGRKLANEWSMYHFPVSALKGRWKNYIGLVGKEKLTAVTFFLTCHWRIVVGDLQKKYSDFLSELRPGVAWGTDVAFNQSFRSNALCQGKLKYFAESLDLTHRLETNGINGKSFTFKKKKERFNLVNAQSAAVNFAELLRKVVVDHFDLFTLTTCPGAIKMLPDFCWKWKLSDEENKYINNRAPDLADLTFPTIAQNLWDQISSHLQFPNRDNEKNVFDQADRLLENWVAAVRQIIMDQMFEEEGKNNTVSTSFVKHYQIVFNSIQSSVRNHQLVRDTLADAIMVDNGAAERFARIVHHVVVGHTFRSIQYSIIHPGDVVVQKWGWKKRNKRMFQFPGWTYTLTSDWLDASRDGQEQTQASIDEIVHFQHLTRKMLSSPLIVAFTLATSFRTDLYVPPTKNLDLCMCAKGGCKCQEETKQRCRCIGERGCICEHAPVRKRKRHGGGRGRRYDGRRRRTSYF